jgi:hypothetical protein
LVGRTVHGAVEADHVAQHTVGKKHRGAVQPRVIDEDATHPDSPDNKRKDAPNDGPQDPIATRQRDDAIDDIHVVEIPGQTTRRTIEERQLLKTPLVAHECPQHPTEDVIESGCRSSRVEQLLPHEEETPLMFVDSAALQREAVESA